MVDDDRSLRDALRRALTLADYEVELAEGGQEALTKIAADEPDAVVLDVGMPGIDGLDVCRRLRAGGNRVPILMLTARESVEDRIDGLDAGADDYLAKPFDVGELKSRLRALLRVAGEDAAAGSNALRVYIGYLRRKLSEAGARPLLHTERGVGYVLREPS